LFGSRILRIDAAGAITRFAGNGTYANSGNGGLATAASFQYITGLAADLSGNLYVGDSLAHVVRRITPAGIVNAFAGTGAAGFSGDNGPASAAALNLTGGAPLAVDRAGDVFIGDGGNNRVRRVDRAAPSPPTSEMASRESARMERRPARRPYTPPRG
jgi:hypothetical protein